MRQHCACEFEDGKLVNGGCGYHVSLQREHEAALAALTEQVASLCAALFPTTTVTPNAATRTVSEFMSDRYFVIDADGELKTRNEYGKALGWAFTQRGAALNAARRQNAFVYDKSTRTVITK